MYVVNERNNKEIKLKVLFDSGFEKSFLSHVPTFICSFQQFQLKTAENVSIETKAFVTPLICIPIEN